ncbi:hypothetical protein [Burkholderia sp. S171]|uniref:hypothetical protein n=1 Tax=Burkholderia sp. S171 TaxID=1641860 RepID=UPI00131D40FA|nr:hypothetical protein [Burkholderia sp. S171]
MSEVLTLSYGYTAKDLAAVREYVQRAWGRPSSRAPIAIPDEDGLAASPSAMKRHLRMMLDSLVKL